MLIDLHAPHPHMKKSLGFSPCVHALVVSTSLKKRKRKERVIRGRYYF
jgi:hypothetical protein